MFGPALLVDVLKDPRMAGEDAVRAAGDLGHALAPAVGHLGGWDQQLAHDRVADEGDQLVLRLDVVVERHRPGAELARDPPHRHGLEAFGIGDLQRGLDDPLARESRLAHPGRRARPDRLRRLLRRHIA
jgi:hypothetical protein